VAGATSTAGGHCGGSRGGRTLRRQSWRGQLAHAVAAKAGVAALAGRVERHSEQLTFIAFREERHSEQLAAAR